MSRDPWTAFHDLRARGSVRWCGLMSGTSGDGIDAAVVECFESGARPRIIGGTTIEFDAETSRRLIADLREPPGADVVTRWDRELGLRFADAARTARDRIGDFDAIAVSGHTFAHLPALPATLQCGNPAMVAFLLDRPVVAEFRRTDVASGGEGAPLVPAADARLFGQPDRAVAILNVGGISNLTWLPPLGQGHPRARDCGPGNLVLNELVRLATAGEETVDRDGRYSLRGEVHSELVAEWLAHPFFGSRRRSTGREEFGEVWVAREARLRELSLPDAAATLCAWIAAAVAKSWQRLAADSPTSTLPSVCLIAGGGAHHPLLRTLIAEALGVPVQSVASIDPEHPIDPDRPIDPDWPINPDHRLDPDHREAAAFAILGHEFLHQRPTAFPETTGRPAPLSLGALFLPGPTA